MHVRAVLTFNFSVRITFGAEAVSEKIEISATGLQELVKKIHRGESPIKGEITSAFNAVLNGDLTPSQVSMFLVTVRMMKKTSTNIEEIREWFQF